MALNLKYSAIYNVQRNSNKLIDNKIIYSQEVYTWAFLGRPFKGVYVRHAQKIAKLFFERAKHAVPFQINYIIHKKIYQPLGPQNTIPLYQT